jgi:hypothetical protein
LYLYYIGTIYEIPRLVGENLDAVVNSYDLFLARYAENLVRKSKKKKSDPGKLLSKLSKMSREKAVAQALKDAGKSNNNAIDTVKIDYESRLDSLRQEADGRVEAEERRTNEWRDANERLKEQARELNRWCKKFSATLKNFYIGVRTPVRML